MYYTIYMKDILKKYIEIFTIPISAKTLNFSVVLIFSHNFKF